MTRVRGRSAGKALWACGLSTALLLGGCGGDDQASEQRIQRERAEAAVIAKQEERIKQLERERREPRRESARQRSVTVVQPAARQPRPAPSQEGSSTRSDDWPGGSGYTTILASVSSQAEARRVQSAASGRGLDAGVLYSTNYRSLRPGFWVVFSGTSSSKQHADQRTARAKSLGYGDAYPRFVSG